MKSFASLDPQESLGIAIAIEERNAEIYLRYADMFTEFGDEESLQIASVFWEMAVEEGGHHAMLQDKSNEQFGTTRCPLSEEDVLEWIEVPRLEQGDLFAPTNGLTASQRALRVALEAELSAQRFYSGLADQTPEGELRRIYCELAQMEDDHVAYLQRKLAQDRYGKPAEQPIARAS
jgi:rubrerythrin